MISPLQSIAYTAALVAGMSPAIAQLSTPSQNSSQVEETMKAQANSANVQAWLESKDPRLIAWGAYFARENNEAVALELAAKLVRTLDQGGPGLLSGSISQNAALSEVLDALIEKRVPLPAETLEYVFRSHPVQAIILLSMLPPDQQTGNLEQWYGGSQFESPGLARVSAMLLSKSPPERFAASVLSNSEERLIVHIAVPIDGVKIGFGSGNAYGSLCADFGAPTPLAGWPELFSYRLHENDTSSADPLLVEAGGDRITWERSSGGGFRSCGGVRGLTPQTRHHLLAEMLGVHDTAMPWQAQKDVTIYKQSDEQIQRDIGPPFWRNRQYCVILCNSFRLRTS